MILGFLLRLQAEVGDEISRSRDDFQEDFGEIKSRLAGIEGKPGKRKG